MALFLVIYFFVLLVLSPLLHQEAPKKAEMQHGEVLKPLMLSAVEKAKHIPHVAVPGQIIAEGMAGIIKRKIDQFRHNKGVTDAELMKKAAEELGSLRKQKNALREAEDRVVVDQAPAAPGKRSGFILLGMHRSGTSMLSGLMATGMGYVTGGPLIGGAFDNEKGFFERIDVVYQNDEFMNKQDVWWSANVVKYDHEKALKMMKEGAVDFGYGKKALTFLNDAKNAPWLQKDPRMCITLKTWLPLISSEPAVLFTYRHPLEVAISLRKREQNFPLEMGLRLWIVYNMRAIQNSVGLCRVFSSNEAILANPLEEVQRISKELTSKCGVPKPREELKQEDVDRFVDPSLQHNKKVLGYGKAEIANIDGCSVHEFDSDAKAGSKEAEREKDLYLKAMTIYCDCKSGAAYKPGYEWPKLAK